MRRILITGGTGFVGTPLARRLALEGHEVAVVTRTLQGRAAGGARISFIEGDPTGQGAWQSKVPEYDVFINLAGESIFKRWTGEAKKRIRESRILATRRLVEAIPEHGGEDRLLISGSAVGYYGARGDEEITEGAAPGVDFLAQVAKDWENEALRARHKGVRVILCRLGIVLHREGGALKKMLPVFKCGLGSPLGSGSQWFPWVHRGDLVRILVFLLGWPDLSGPFNCTAPYPVRNAEMTKTLGAVLGRPTFLPRVPAWALRIVLGEFGTTLLQGQKVVPARLLESGFQFEYSTFEAAARDLLMGPPR